jgi:hypothetical protein
MNFSSGYFWQLCRVGTPLVPTRKYPPLTPPILLRLMRSFPFAKGGSGDFRLLERETTQRMSSMDTDKLEESP